MVGVHHRVAHLDLGQVTQHAVNLAAAAAVAALGAHGGRVQLGFGDIGQWRLGVENEAIGQGCHAQQRATRQGGTAGVILTQCGFEAVFGEILRHGFTPSQAFRQQDYLAGKLADEILDAV